MRFLPLVGALLVASAAARDDLAWENNPKQWHQQMARIVDHRFTTFDELVSGCEDAGSTE
jgi:hypothetical protein